MKKVICLVCSLLMLLSSAYSVSAMGGLKINTEFDGEKDSLYITGAIDIQRKSVPVILKISKDNKIVGAQQIIADKIENNSLVFSFEPYKFLSDATTGAYKINVSANYLDMYYEDTFQYYGIDDLYEIMKKIQLNTASKNYGELEKVFSVYNKELSIDFESYTKLSESGKRKMLSFLSNEAFNLPEECLTKENRAKVKNEIIHLRKSYSDTLAIASFVTIASANDLVNWVNKYYAVYEFDKDDKNTSEINEGEIFKYYNKLKAKNSIYNHFGDINKRNVNTIKKVKDVFYEYALLTVIETEHYSTGKAVIEKFPSFFNINWTKFNKLSEKIKNSVYTELPNNTYEKYSDVAAIFNNAVKDKEDSGNGGSKGGGSGGASAWGGSSNSNSQVTFENNRSQEINKNPSVDNGPFDDIDDVTWAKNSILSLYKKGIINGVGNRRFNPNQKITRAEFTKLALNALNIISEDNLGNPFDDVFEGDWYYKYITTALKKGYVLGVGNNKFAPNDFVERQNMVTILYRMIGTPQITDFDLLFKDADKINDYALDSVKFFSQNGIVNGEDNGMFKPDGYATRAEAAHILYNLINSGLIVE